MTPHFIALLWGQRGEGGGWATHMAWCAGAHSDVAFHCMPVGSRRGVGDDAAPGSVCRREPRRWRCPTPLGACCNGPGGSASTPGAPFRPDPHPPPLRLRWSLAAHCTAPSSPVFDFRACGAHACAPLQAEPLAAFPTPASAPCETPLAAHRPPHLCPHAFSAPICPQGARLRQRSYTHTHTHPHPHIAQLQVIRIPAVRVHTIGCPVRECAVTDACGTAGPATTRPGTTSACPPTSWSSGSPWRLSASRRGSQAPSPSPPMHRTPFCNRVPGKVLASKLVASTSKIDRDAVHSTFS